MIFVTVSLDIHPFERLIKKADEIAAKIEEEVIIQGCIDYETNNAKYIKHTTREKMLKLIEEARLVISHAGAGTIIQVFEHHKPLIVVPRMKQFGEHYNDHQIEIANQIKDRKGIKVVYDIDELENIMDFSEKPDCNFKGKITLVNEIKNYLSQLYCK